MSRGGEGSGETGPADTLTLVGSLLCGGHPYLFPRPWGRRGEKFSKPTGAGAQSAPETQGLRDVGRSHPSPPPAGGRGRIRAPRPSEPSHRGFLLESLKPVKPLTSIKGHVLSFFSPLKGLEEFCQDKLPKGTRRPRGHQPGFSWTGTGARMG